MWQIPDYIKNLHNSIVRQIENGQEIWTGASWTNIYMDSVQIKTMRYYLTPTRKAEIKKIDYKKHWCEYGMIGTLTLLMGL